jgi:hypothetical protein
MSEEQSDVVGQQIHQSDSKVQKEAEAIVLAQVSEKLGVPIQQKVRLVLDDAKVELDGASADESVLVEVFARVGKLKGAQLHKVSTDTLKLLALAETRPSARLVLAFADQDAADSVVGWRAAVLARHKIEKVVVELSTEQRQLILDAQAEQKIGMAGADTTA